MIKNLSLGEKGKQSVEKEFFALLEKSHPERLIALKKVKPLILIAGFLFGVVIFMILTQDQNPDYVFAFGVGFGVSILGITVEYLTWKILIKSMFRNYKAEMNKEN